MWNGETFAVSLDIPNNLSSFQIIALNSYGFTTCSCHRNRVCDGDRVCDRGVAFLLCTIKFC